MASADFQMPSLGADMESGTLLEWRVKIGDRVRRGDIVALVDTEKAAVEVEIFLDGVIEQILVPVGEKVPVGTPLARLRTDAVETAPAPAPPPAPAAESAPRARISPAARRRAEELGIDPARLRGTGPDGAITLADVEQAGPQPPAEEPPDRAARLRAAIAGAMSRSNREIPHYYLATTVPMARALAWLQDHNQGRSLQQTVLPAALFVRTVALALRKHPDLNAIWKDGALERKRDIHVGMAVSLRGGGVVVPAVLGADALTVDAIMTQLHDLVARARSGGLKSSELSEGTITITNLGDRAPEAVYGVIFPPQVALVGFGAVVERPWVVDAQVLPRHVCTVTLAADHRATDGHLGGKFLAEIDRLLQHPEEW